MENKDTGNKGWGKLGWQREPGPLDAVGFGNNRRRELSLVRKETASVQKENELGTETIAIQ